MDCLYISDLYELAEYMTYCIEDKSEVVAVLFFEDAKELMRIFLSDYQMDVGLIDITNVEYDGYEGEYYISLSSDGMLSVEPAWGEDMYLQTCADLLLIDGDASSDIVLRNIGSECKELCFTEYDDEDEECCDCHSECCGCNDNCHDEDGDIAINIDIDCEIGSIYHLLNYLFNL